MKTETVVVACPRLMRVLWTTVPCERDVAVTVGGGRGEPAWVEQYDAPCGHVLTDAECDLVLDAALEDLWRRAYADDGGRD